MDRCCKYPGSSDSQGTSIQISPVEKISSSILGKSPYIIEVVVGRFFG